MPSMASQATPQGPRGFSLASMITAPLGNGRESARANMGSVTIGNPTVAAAAAAAESCRKERRERQAGFLPLAWTHLHNGARIARRAAHKLSRSASPALSICMRFLASQDLCQEAAHLPLQRLGREEKGKREVGVA